MHALTQRALICAANKNDVAFIKVVGIIRVIRVIRVVGIMKVISLDY
jgi:hypothetical protein